MGLFGFSGAMMNGVQGLLPQAPEPTRGRGFFGRGGTGRNIAGYIGDALMAQAGMRPIYGPAMAEQADAVRQMRAAQAKRQTDFEDWKRRQDYGRANPAPAQPTQTDRYLAEIQDPNTPPQRKALLRQILLRPIGVPVYGENGSVETKFYYPDQMPGANAPTGGDDEWEYIDSNGGPSPQGSGGFRPY